MLDDIDPKSAVPLYEQIALGIKAAVTGGDLRPGDPLPSVRQLAGRHRINPATVVQAYRRLEEEGFAELRQGAGSFVRSVPAELRSRERCAQARRLVRDLLAKAASSGITPTELREALRSELDGGSHR